MANYLTVEQAAESTGKSVRTIRRLLYDESSKNFISRDEKNRLLVDANFLAQHYPLISSKKGGKTPKSDNRQSFAKSIDTTNDIDNPTAEADLLVKVKLLEQELRHKEELSREKDKRIDVLERSLLLLEAGQKKEPTQPEHTTAVSPSPETVIPSPEPSTAEPSTAEPSKKKRWWQF